MREIVNDPKELFRRWYKVPLEVLGNYTIVRHGDGGWITMATCCFLFERYVSGKLKKQKPNASDVENELRIAFGTDEHTAHTFWQLVRHGLLHMGMPKQDKGITWVIYDDLPEFKLNNEKNTLFINIWKFRDKVLAIIDANPDYLLNPRNPWGHIWRVIPD